MYFGHRTLRNIFPAAHKLKSGISSSVGQCYSVCPEKMNHCFQFVSQNLTCLHEELSLANVDKDSANLHCKNFLGLRPQ